MYVRGGGGGDGGYLDIVVLCVKFLSVFILYDRSYHSAALCGSC